MTLKNRGVKPESLRAAAKTNPQRPTYTGLTRVWKSLNNAAPDKSPITINRREQFSHLIPCLTGVKLCCSFISAGAACDSTLEAHYRLGVRARAELNATPDMSNTDAVCGVHVDGIRFIAFYGCALLPPPYSPALWLASSPTPGTPACSIRHQRLQRALFFRPQQLPPPASHWIILLSQ